MRSVIIISLLSGLAYGAVYTDPAQLNGKTYDYVVVGGGTAGNVVAARLAEVAKYKVLVIEAGIS
jgi:choline dehydrogenase